MSGCLALTVPSTVSQPSASSRSLGWWRTSHTTFTPSRQAPSQRLDPLAPPSTGWTDPRPTPLVYYAQAVHCGDDLKSAAAAVLGYSQEGRKGRSVNMPPIEGVATAELRDALIYVLQPTNLSVRCSPPCASHCMAHASACTNRCDLACLLLPPP